MEIRIECACGTHFKFDVEPVNGRMPVGIGCPNCSLDATTAANEIIARSLAQTAPPAPPPPPVALRLSGGSPRPAPAPAESAPPEDFETSAVVGGGSGLLNRTIYLVKERVGMFKLVDTYDIFDPASGQQIGIAKEEPPVWAKWLRLVISKSKLPTSINVYESEEAPPVFSVNRGLALIGRPRLQVNQEGRRIGYFRSKFFSIGGGFNVFNLQDQQVAEVKGNWKGWDFQFVTKQGREIGKVTKKWAGLGRELFTSADNYVISLSGVGANPESAVLLLAAGLTIDIVLKESE